MAEKTALAVEEQCLLSNGQPTKGCFEFLALALEAFSSVTVLSTERGRVARQLGTLEHCWRRAVEGPLPKPIVARLSFAPFRPPGSRLLARDCVNFRGRLPSPAALLPTVSQDSVETPSLQTPELVS